jgi:xanthosine utilization system XapX-like protein
MAESALRLGVHSHLQQKYWEIPDCMEVCVRWETCFQPQRHCLHQQAHPDHLCQLEVAADAVKRNGMGIVVGAVVEILWVEICAPPVVAGVSVEGQVHHLQQLMFDEQDVVQVKLNVAQRRGHWQSTVQQPAVSPYVQEDH